ncbi:MAG: bifunctional aminoglycoside phosphotransferase/ATP-binding protein [Hyphomicrobium sp.]
MIVEDQIEVIEFLSRPESYRTVASFADNVERIDTHASIVFLNSDRAYKLKRAVKFPYLDFSTRDLRRRYCEAEVRINRRTAPHIYLGVRCITRAAGGALRLNGEGEPVDWVVEMVRFDEETLFDRLAKKGVLDRFAMEDLADTIARFHSEAERHPESGGRSLVAKVIESNTRSFAEAGPRIFEDEKVRSLTEISWRALAKAEDLLEERRRDGFVRHCHGDLHLRNIFLYKGQATLFDAIEFRADLAQIDVLYDVAFLVMDLDHRSLRPLASIVLNRYLDNTADAGGLGTLPLFLSLRAAIRSHITAVAAACQSAPDKANLLQHEARSYLDRAIHYLMPRPRRLIAIGGLSGSGKSRLARWLAPHVGAPPGARVVRTDSTRKRLAGIALGSRLGSRGYSSEMNKRTYQAVFDECAQVLAAGQSAIADAVFADPEERKAIERVAAKAGVPFHGMWLETSPEIMQERVTRRARNVSDANAWVVRLQLQYDPGELTWTRLDSSGSRDETMAAALQILNCDLETET